MADYSHEMAIFISLEYVTHSPLPPHASGAWWQSKTLRKHTYSNTLKILHPKKENFQVKNSDIFHISVQNIDCGYLLEPPLRGGSNEYAQSMFF